MSDVPYLFTYCSLNWLTLYFVRNDIQQQLTVYFSSSIVCTGRYHNLCSNPSAMLKPWGLPRNIRIGKTTRLQQSCASILTMFHALVVKQIVTVVITDCEVIEVVGRTCEPFSRRPPLEERKVAVVERWPFQICSGEVLI